MNATARTRFGKIMLKSGGSVRVLHPDRNKDRSFIEARVRHVLDMQGEDLAGMAFIVWGADNSSTCYTSVNPNSRIPSVMVPDFVRNRLLVDKAVNWAVDQTLEELGYTISDPDPAA